MDINARVCVYISFFFLGEELQYPALTLSKRG